MIKKTLGLFSIIVGIIVLLCNLDIIEFTEISKYLLASFIMVIGVVGMVENKKVSFLYFVLFLLGVLSLILTINIFDKELISSYILPAFLILIGIRILTFGYKGVPNFQCKILSSLKRTFVEPEVVEPVKEVKKKTTAKPKTTKTVKKEEKK